MHAWSRKKLLQMLNLQIKAKKKGSLWKLGSKTSGCPCTARLLWDVMRPTRHMGVFRRGWV